MHLDILGSILCMLYDNTLTMLSALCQSLNKFQICEITMMQRLYL
jgi:hypothetical protein